MIAYVKGVVAEIEEHLIVVEANLIGYNIFVPSGYNYGVGEEVKIYTYTNVKEDAFQLYGFESKEQLDLFKLLITVNGIGPKGGLAILSSMSLDQLILAIHDGDAGMISKAPGIGKKTAERVILDLKDKVSLDSLEDISGFAKPASVTSIKNLSQEKKDAVDALVALGYGSTEATKAVATVEDADGLSADEILKKSLRFLF